MIRTTAFRSTLAFVAVSLLAACGTPQASSGPTDPPATDAPATAAPTAEPGFSFALPSGFNADQDLEALLPDTIGGAPVQKLSMTGDSFMGSGQGTEDLQAVLDALGKTPSDLSVAFGGSLAASLIAFRIKGVSAGDTFNAFLDAAEDQDVTDLTDVTIAGKPAKKLVDADGNASYLYFAGDALITVAATTGDLSQATLDEIFGQLP